MGFTTGLLSGATLTTSILYLTLLIHRQNRYAQSHALANSTAALTAIYDPPPIRTPPSERVVNGGLLEMAKDRWNQELTENVRRLHYTDWRQKGQEWVEMGEGVGRAVVRSLRSLGEENEGK